MLSKAYPHPEEHPEGASRRTQGRSAGLHLDSCPASTLFRLRLLHRDKPQNSQASDNQREEGIIPALFRQVYLRQPEGNHGTEVKEVIDLLVKAGIGWENITVHSAPGRLFFGERSLRRLTNFGKSSISPSF